jgi:PAS domain S-box-containing protein
LAPDTNDTHEDWIQRLHPDDRARTVQHFIDAVNGATEQLSSQYRIIRPNDGQVRWIATEARIERSPDSQPLRLVGAHIDITDLAVAKEALRESEERFRLIANSAPVPMWVTRLDRKRAFANQAYVDFLGVDYDEALAFDWRKILHPDDGGRIVNESVAGEASLRPFVLEARYRRSDGQWRWMRSESQPRWDPAGRHIGFIGVAHDVTVAKEAEYELRRLNETLEQRIRERTSQLQSREAQMRAIFETSNQYQCLLDLQGNVLYANTTALAGIRADEDITGKLFWNTPWFSGTVGMREIVLDAFDAAAKGESVRTEMRLNLAAGERFFDFTMRPVFDQHGVVSGVLPEAVDITERRQAEDALRQSQKMDAVGQLTGGVAHDFNNLLTIIRSATDFLRRRELSDDRRRRYIDAISDTVDRASKLTGQLLAFARRQPLTPQVFNVGSQVESIAQLIRPLMSLSSYQTRSLIPSVLRRRMSRNSKRPGQSRGQCSGCVAGEGSLSISVNTVDAIPPFAVMRCTRGSSSLSR